MLSSPLSSIYSSYSQPFFPNCTTKSLQAVKKKGPLTAFSVMEEFLESEVVWPENLHANSICYETTANPANQHTTASNCGNGSTASTPIAIPGTSSTALSCDRSNWCKEEECTDEQVPPHVLVLRRRNTGKLAFPLCSGQGRTLKGRDLRDVRNAVWRMTGFLDG